MCTAQLQQLVYDSCGFLFSVDDCPNHYRRYPYKAAAEEVCIICNAEEALLFKVMEDIIVDPCYSCPQVSPQPLNPGKLE